MRKLFLGVIIFNLFFICTIGECALKDVKNLEYKIGRISQYQRYTINDPILGKTFETVRVSDKNIWFGEETLITFIRNKSNNQRALGVQVTSKKGWNNSPFFYLNIDGQLFRLVDKSYQNVSKDVEVYGGYTYVESYKHGWRVYSTPPVVLVTIFTEDGWILPDEIVNKLKKAKYVAIRTNSGNRLLTEEIVDNALQALKVWAKNEDK